MGLGDKAKNKGEELVGKAKATVGDATDNPDLEAEGRTQEAKADVKQAGEDVKVMGCRVIDQYAVLGRYDFITIVEAPDPETMAKVSVELGSRGTMTSETVLAIPADKFADSIRS